MKQFITFFAIMNFSYLQSFCTVYITKSFAKTARKEGVSTASITRRIQQLETELDTKLFHRTTRQLAPTHAGDLFYEEACEILATYDNCVRNLQSLKSDISGTIKIGVPASLSHLYVAPNLHKLYNQYPNLQLRLITGNHLLDLLTDRFDLVIHCGHLPNSDFYFHPLGEWHKITCASPNYIKQHGEPKHPNDLEQHFCIDHYDSLHHAWHYTINQQEKNIFIHSQIQANSSLGIKAIAQAGIGITYLPCFTINKELASGKLTEVLAQFRPKPLPMYAVFPHQRKNSHKIQVILEYLHAVLPL